MLLSLSLYALLSLSLCVLSLSLYALEYTPHASTRVDGPLVSTRVHSCFDAAQRLTTGPLQVLNYWLSYLNLHELLQGSLIGFWHTNYLVLTKVWNI